MLFSVGDKVQLINDNVKGIILQLTSYKAIIEDEDGFEIEVLLTNLCLQTNIADYNLNNDNILIAIEQKEFIEEEKKQSIGHLKRSVLEVDIHIHHLTSSTRNMTNHDMVLLQLKKVKETLNRIDRKIHSKIVFIHGVGSGKLRNEIEILLNKQKYNFQDASFEKYGSGALEIVL
ncbi:MAG: hypothetical protein ACPGVH_04320 [Chitinophagales bacterium]